MAKFDSILGTGSGSLGNHYVRTAKAPDGRTINVLATKNFSPKNPRTSSQMAQRAKFACAVKFYKRATRNFFKFAYEDQHANESDYNAFMRHNIAAAVPLARYHTDYEVFPAIGNKWMLSQGSLAPVQVLDNGLDSTNHTEWEILLNVPADLESIMTVGDLSEIFVKSGFKDGDIVTIVAIGSGIKVEDYKYLDADSAASAAANAGSVPLWRISQFIIDQDSDENLADVKFLGDQPAFNDFEIDKDGLTSFFMNSSFNSDDYPLGWAGIIVTRKDGNKLLANTTFLQGNPAVQSTLISYLDTPAYYDAMLESWKSAKDVAILKGSIAGNDNSGGSSSGVPRITKVNNYQVPATNWTPQDSGTIGLTGRNLNKADKSNFAGTNGVTIESYTAASSTSATLTYKYSSDGTNKASITFNGQVIVQQNAM